MSTQWTAEQVLALAPDAGSARAGQGLAKPTKWKSIGCSPRAVWGEIQGSGKKPYQVRIDLAEPAFKCTCPSRKFPCKHGLGLFLLFAQSPGKFEESEAPGWVSDWLKDRDSRREKQASRQDTAREVDPAAQARRAEKRDAKVRQGAAELSTWLSDLVRQGLAAAQSQPWSYWDAMAARMVDAQAPGLARYVRRLGGTAGSGEDWQERTLAIIGQLHLLLNAYERIDTLPEALQADVRALLGWTTPKEELAGLPNIEDRWAIVGQVTRHEEQFRVQRTWLWGRATQRFAMVLQFAAGTQAFETILALGTEFAGRVVYYPSACPLRAVVVDRGDGGLIDGPLPVGVSLGEARAEYAQALSRQPWLELWPVQLSALTPGCNDSNPPHWCLTDSSRQGLFLQPKVHCGWELLAIGGGGPVDVFGEWDGYRLRPLSASAKARFFVVTEQETGPRLTRVA